MWTWIISGTIGCIFGGAVVWVGKEKMQSLWTDANTISARLRAKADAIAQAARKV